MIYINYQWIFLALKANNKKVFKTYTYDIW